MTKQLSTLCDSSSTESKTKKHRKLSKTVSIDIQDRLINGQVGEVAHANIAQNTI